MSTYSRESTSMLGAFQHQRDKLEPMIQSLNKKLMNVSLDNIRIIYQNQVLLDVVKQKNEQIEQ